jgi:hypothetical protein
MEFAYARARTGADSHILTTIPKTVKHPLPNESHQHCDDCAKLDALNKASITNYYSMDVHFGMLGS